MVVRLIDRGRLPVTRQIDFFFFIGSTYTYLTVMRIEELSARVDVKVRWRPFNARAIMIEQNNIPFRGKPVKTRYMWRDLERRARKYGVPFAEIPPYPVDSDMLGSRVAVLAANEGWCPEYTKAVYSAWFLEHQAPGDVDELRKLLQELNHDPDRVLEQANSKEVRDTLEAETDVARSHGIFGSPTFLVGNEIFWGDDRLEDAIEWATSDKI